MWQLFPRLWNSILWELFSKLKVRNALFYFGSLVESYGIGRHFYSQKLSSGHSNWYMAHAGGRQFLAVKRWRRPIPKHSTQPCWQARELKCIYAGVTGNNVPWNKCPGNNIFYFNDLNLRSLVSIAMHLNPSTNNKLGHFFQGTTITATTV
jgi:hypothetical protein